MMTAYAPDTAVLPPQGGHTLQPSLSAAYTGDDALIASWLRDRPTLTVKVYASALAAMLEHVGTPIRAVTRPALEAWLDDLGPCEPATYNKKLSAVQSLFRFAHSVGYVTINPAIAIPRRRLEDKLAERILTEAQVHRVLAMEDDPRNHLIIRIGYVGGLRCFEIAGLRWRHVNDTGDAVVLTVYGKRGKTRWVRLSPETGAMLMTLRPEGAQPDDAVFHSREGGALDNSQIWRVVTAAMRRAGVDGQAVHSLRHSHVSHNLDRGTPVHVVSQTVGHASLASTTRYAHIRPTESSATRLGL